VIPSIVIEQACAVPIEAEIARRGIKLRGKVERVGSCPRCGGTDRFAVNVAKQIWNCRGCRQGGNVIDLVRHLDGFRDAVETLTGGTEVRPQVRKPSRPTEPDPPDDYEERQARKAAWLWLQRARIEGSPAERYLREVRGYSGPLPATLGFLPPARPEHLPAMIAAFALVDEPEPGVVGEPHGITSVHLTLLKPDGSGKADVKPNKLVIGRPLGRPIVLTPPNDLLGLAITEGIEDALSVHQATGLGAWAAGSAPFMPAIAEAVLDYIEAVTIYAHNDPAGQDGAQKLAEALTRRGIEVLIKGLAP
jgi:hypothetical protein